MAWASSFSASDLLFVCLVALFLVLEWQYPNKRYETSWRWVFLSASLLISGLLLTACIGWVTAGRFNTHALLPAFSAYWTHTPPVLNGLVGYLCVTFINYWWHRFRHQSDFLWRTFHQIHHSTHRLQTIAAFYSHPFDYYSTVIIINLVAYGLFGFNVESAAFTTAWVGVFEVWEHTNIRTPIWLGYLIVRPEMHRIHHEFGKHQNNYGLPLWDMIFGTYENSNREVKCGFTRQREARLADMLLLRDVHQR